MRGVALDQHGLALEMFTRKLTFSERGINGHRLCRQLQAIPVGDGDYKAAGGGRVHRGRCCSFPLE